MKQTRAFVIRMAPWLGIGAALAVGIGVDRSFPNLMGGSPSSAVAQEPAQNEVTVRIPVGATGMGPAAYGQNPLTVPVGTTVTWINDDSTPHTATSDTGVWDSGTLNQGGQFSFTFSNPGTYPYYCTIHGRTSMSGTIEVSAGGASPTPTASPQPGATPSPTVTASPTVSPTVSPTPGGTPAPGASPQPGEAGGDGGGGGGY